MRKIHVITLFGHTVNWKPCISNMKEYEPLVIQARWQGLCSITIIYKFMGSWNCSETVPPVAQSAAQHRLAPNHLDTWKLKFNNEPDYLQVHRATTKLGRRCGKSMITLFGRTVNWKPSISNMKEYESCSETFPPVAQSGTRRCMRQPAKKMTDISWLAELIRILRRWYWTWHRKKMHFNMDQQLIFGKSYTVSMEHAYTFSMEPVAPWFGISNYTMF